LSAVFDETMRLYPPVPFIPRLAVANDDLGGYHVPAATMVLLSVFALHRRPDLWPDPLRFDPERFMATR
jgi:cytochrome P450